MPSQIAVFLVGVAATYAFLWALAYFNQDSREPTPVAGSVPLVSPLVGLMAEKEGYYVRMRQAAPFCYAILRRPSGISPSQC